MVLDGHERNGQMVVKLPWDEVPESLGYHDYCYRRFTDIKRIRGAEKRCEQKAHLYDNENNKEEGQQLGEEGVPDDNIDYEPSPKKNCAQPLPTSPQGMYFQLFALFAIVLICTALLQGKGSRIVYVKQKHNQLVCSRKALFYSVNY